MMQIFSIFTLLFIHKFSLTVPVKISAFWGTYDIFFLRLKISISLIFMQFEEEKNSGITINKINEISLSNVSFRYGEILHLTPLISY